MTIWNSAVFGFISFTHQKTFTYRYAWWNISLWNV